MRPRRPSSRRGAFRTGRSRQSRPTKRWSKQTRTSPSSSYRRSPQCHLSWTIEQDCQQIRTVTTDLHELRIILFFSPKFCIYIFCYLFIPLYFFSCKYSITFRLLSLRFSYSAFRYKHLRLRDKSAQSLELHV